MVPEIGRFQSTEIGRNSNNNYLIILHFHLETYYFYNNTVHEYIQPFYSSLDFDLDNLGELVPEGIFCHLLDFLVQNEDNTGRHINNPDGLPPNPD